MDFFSQTLRVTHTNMSKTQILRLLCTEPKMAKWSRGHVLGHVDGMRLIGWAADVPEGHMCITSNSDSPESLILHPKPSLTSPHAESPQNGKMAKNGKALGTYLAIIRLHDLGL